MKIMVIGGGGREHALAWKLAQSPKAEKIYALPGNPGMAAVAECITDVQLDNIDAVVGVAMELGIDMAVVGPEAPLTKGLVDAMNAAGIRAFGPTRAAAELEGSKAYAKDIMQKYGIPTAKYKVFTRVADASAYVEEQGAPIVIKADGLAAGKGVVVAQTVQEALRALGNIMNDRSFGTAGARVVVEECMVGEEASLLAFTDGETIVPMVSSQDHKRAYDGDNGPNTGGMGTYAPAPVMTPEITEQAVEKILRPIIAAMKQEGRPYKGCLYAGLMITEEGPKVVEFNARFGDPETQVVIPLLESDLVDIMLACCDGTLAEQDIKWSGEAAVCVVMASDGYPGGYPKGLPIRGIEDAEANGALVFQAGTSLRNNRLVTGGGRVLGVVSKAGSIKEAVNKVYENVGKIHFHGAQYRRDIAYKALARI